MIIFRYLAKDTLNTMLAVTGVLLLIVVGGRLIRYMAKAAAGELNPEALFLIMAYRVPEFLELILPLGLFLGILLAYGRLYMDSEMTILSACGISQQKLLTMTLVIASVVSALIALMSLYLSPWGETRFQNLLTAQESLSAFDTLTPGRFQSMRSQDQVVYSEGLSKDRAQLNNVFISETIQNEDRKAPPENPVTAPTTASPESQTLENRTPESQAKGEPTLLVVLAQGGRQVQQPDSESQYLVLENGTRYEGQPGQMNYRVIEYERFGQRIVRQLQERRGLHLKDIPTAELIYQLDRPYTRAEFQWRISQPLAALVVAVLAFPLSRISPRQGRYSKLLPGVFLYIAYLIALLGVRDLLEKAKIPIYPGLWAVHGLFLLVGLSLLTDWQALRSRRLRRAFYNRSVNPSPNQESANAPH